MFKLSRTSCSRTRICISSGAIKAFLFDGSVIIFYDYTANRSVSSVSLSSHIIFCILLQLVVYVTRGSFNLRSTFNDLNSFRFYLSRVRRSA